eukprot:18801-Amorphochlora_amoeboformis.AAC.1
MFRGRRGSFGHYQGTCGLASMHSIQNCANTNTRRDPGLYNMGNHPNNDTNPMKTNKPHAIRKSSPLALTRMGSNSSSGNKRVISTPKLAMLVSPSHSSTRNPNHLSPGPVTGHLNANGGHGVLPSNVNDTNAASAGHGGSAGNSAQPSSPPLSIIASNSDSRKHH